MLASEAATTKSYLTAAKGSKVVRRRKPEIPVIRQTAPNKDHHIRGAATNSLELSRVINLLEDHLTAPFKERHIFVLQKLLKKFQNGFLLKELNGIARILNICAERTKDHPEYVSVLCDLLQICRLPFLKEKASDEVTYAHDVTEFLSHMGCLMRISNADVRYQICDAIKSFYVVTFRQLPDELQGTRPGYKLLHVELSGLAETMVLSLAVLESQLAVRLQVLQTLQILSGSSDVNRRLIVDAHGADTICLHMNEPDPSGQVLFRSSKILWNLLEGRCKDEVTSQLSSMDCVVSLKEAFFHQLLSGFGHHDLQLRNDLLVITTLIAENPKSHMIESLFAKQIIPFVTFPELKSKNPLVRNLKLTRNSEDFELKRLLLSLVVVLSKDLSALQLFREAHVMLALLTLARPPPAPAGERHHSGSGGVVDHWSPAQREELQLHALATLATVARLLLEDYVACQGNTCLLLLLEWCAEQDGYFGRGHSLHGAGGRGSKRAQVRYCMMLLRSVTSLGNETINQDLCDQGAISQLLGILMQMGGSPDEGDAVTLEIKADIQLILSALCENDLHRKELFGTEGVEMAVHFLKMSPEKFYSGLGHNRLILSTVDCVWSCIVGCYTTEDYFLAKEGAFLLLDLLRSSPRSMHSVVLGTLLELSDNPKTLSHILSWRDEESQTAPHLLLELWRQEEAELGVRRDLRGKITDLKKPILCRHQEEDSQVSLPASGPSGAVMDVSENPRANIYSIFCKLGYEDLPGLSTKDFITLSIVNRYLDFKVGEVWDEVTRELALDGVRPVTPDVEALETIAKITEDTARRVSEAQSSMVERQETEELSEEKLMYTEIKSRWKQQELVAKSWDQYVAKTSDYKTLKEVKAQREKCIESSRRPHAKHEDAIFHPTEEFHGRVKAIESSPAQLTGGAPANARVVVERVPVHGEAPKRDSFPSAQDPPQEYFSTVSVQ